MSDWECWGRHCSAQFFKFVSQMVVIIIILLFCVAKLLVNENGNKSNVVYFSLIGNILGVFMPSPSYRRAMKKMTEKQPGGGEESKRSRRHGEETEEEEEEGGGETEEEEGRE